MGSVAIPSGGGGTGIPKEFSITSYQRNGSKTQSVQCEVGDVIVVTAEKSSSGYEQSTWDPTPSSEDATVIDYQTYNDNGSARKTGVIAVAKRTTVSITWHGNGSTYGTIKVIHTDRLKRSTYTLEKANAAAMSSKTITGLKVGDLIVGNCGNTGSEYNSISGVQNAAALMGNNSYAGASYLVIGDTAIVTLGGSSSQYSIVAFRQ